MLVELKSSRNANARAIRQTEAMTSIADYLGTDRSDDMFGNPGPTVRVSMHAEESDHCYTLNSLIATAQRDGHSFSETEPGLFYYVSNGNGDVAKFLNFAASRCKGPPLICFANEEKFTSGGYSPFTLSITNPKAAFDFWAGQLVIVVVADTQEIKDAFERRGYGVDCDFDGARPITVFIPGIDATGEGQASIGSHLFSRLFTEFLSLEWMVEAIVHQTTEAITNPEIVALAYPGNAITHPPRTSSDLNIDQTQVEG